MNKLTKSELIEKIKDLPNQGEFSVKRKHTPQELAAIVFENACNQCASIIKNTEIIPDPVPDYAKNQPYCGTINPVPEVDTELEEAKKLVGTWVKCEGMGSTLYEVIKAYRYDHERVKVISDGGHHFESKWCTPATPVSAVDTELEEAKKRFPVGSWFRNSSQGSTIHKVDKIVRRCGQLFIEDDSSFNRFILNNCTPATLPTAKWRCMKTDVENSIQDRIVNLDGVNHIGWYDVAKRAWFIRGCLYIDLSCYDTALWLEIPRGE